MDVANMGNQKNLKKNFPWLDHYYVKKKIVSKIHVLTNHIRLFIGEGRGRFKASDIISDPNRKDCYLATLTIADMISSDSRLYFVTIANERGETRYGINVRVCTSATHKQNFIHSNV